MSLSHVAFLPSGVQPALYPSICLAHSTILFIPMSLTGCHSEQGEWGSISSPLSQGLACGGQSWVYVRVSGSHSRAHSFMLCPRCMCDSSISERPHDPHNLKCLLSGPEEPLLPPPGTHKTHKLLTPKSSNSTEGL